MIECINWALTATSVKELARKQDFSDASFYLWRSRGDGMDLPDANRLRELEPEISRRKRLLADAVLDNEALKVVVRGIR